MDRQAIFTDLMAILEQSAPDLGTDGMVLDDRPFAEQGVDSMLMLQLVGQVEAKFDITINDSDVLVAFSFDRLVDLIAAKTAGPPTSDLGTADLLSTAVAAALAARGGADRARLRFVGRDHDPVQLTHEEFLRASVWLGRCLPAATGQQTVLVAAADPVHILLAFFAALSRGAHPLVLPGPKAIGGTDVFHDRVERLVAGFGGGVTLAMRAGDIPDVGRLSGIPILELPADLASYGRESLPAEGTVTAASDVAFLQATSASTGDPQLVGVSHANVISNLTALKASLDMDGGQRTFSWLPLYHDMGLLGGALFPILSGFSAVLMKHTDFIRSPGRWIRGMSEERSTFSGAPNFALDYAARAIPQRELENVDLSRLRRVGVAAEPIHRGAMQRFVDRFAPYGLRPDSLVPGLGLAESTLATTTRVGKIPRYLVLASGGAVMGERVPILAEGHVRSPEEDPVPIERPDGSRVTQDVVDAGVAVFSLGVPLAGITVGFQDDAGAPIEADEVLGEIVVSGPSVCAGYYDPQAERPVPFENGILRTGDLGFRQGGEVFVLDRKKNVIIRRGANFSASLLEQRVAEVLNVPPHLVMILEEDITVADSAVHVVIESAEYLALPDADQSAALRQLDLPVDVVTYVRGFALPRTSSGKKRYHVCRRMLAEDGFPVVSTVRL